MDRDFAKSGNSDASLWKLRSALWTSSGARLQLAGDRDRRFLDLGGRLSHWESAVLPALYVGTVLLLEEPERDRGDDGTSGVSVRRIDVVIAASLL